MQPYQQQFLELILRTKVLTFGEFTLKSGRVSPYFFNAGLFSSGKAISELGGFYARGAIETVEPATKFDVVFGPAYKGIPLATAMGVALFRDFGRDVPVAYNRKEAKTHGEGGILVGADVRAKRVLIVDDVITAGTAIYEAVDILTAAGAKPVGVLIALDRQERGRGDRSAIRDVEEKLGLPVTSLITLEHIIGYLRAQDDPELVARVEKYRAEWGV